MRYLVLRGLIAACILLPGARTAEAQEQTPPLTVEHLLGLLATGMPEARILQLVAEACVILGADPAAQAQLEEAGASSALRRTAEAFACSEAIALASSPPPSATLGVGFGDDQFSLIPAGTFEMGSANGGSDARPVRPVTISRAFLMQRTEVTQGQWREIMGANPSSFISCGEACPVEGVSWTAVQEFLAALNERYPGRNYRLPSEAEWEYAARAGTTGDYGGTGELDDMGWYRDNSGSRTHPVAQKQPNAWGLYDMHGNVWEWVQDWYSSDYYEDSPAIDPTGPGSGSSRVLRGGSSGFNAFFARSANRYFSTPSYRVSTFGFRLARTP